MRQITPLVSNAQRGEAKASCRNTRFGRADIEGAAKIIGGMIEHMAIAGIGLLPEIEAPLLLERVQEGFVRCRWRKVPTGRSGGQFGVNCDCWLRTLPPQPFAVISTPPAAAAIPHNA